MSFLKQKYLGINSIANPKLTQIPTKTFKGRLSSGIGNVEDVSLRDLLLLVEHYYHIAQNDFESGVINPWGTTNTGVGTSNALITPPDTQSCGVIQSSTGNTATGLAGLRYSAATSMFTASAGELISISKVRLPVLSTAAQGFDIRIGFGDSISAADHTDSCGYFEYSHDVNGGNWVIATANNATRTKTNTVVAPLANQWIYLKTITNSTATQTDFYINNNLVGSITTNIPTTTTRAFDYTCFILKWVGTTARTLLTDRCFIARERTDVDNY